MAKIYAAYGTLMRGNIMAGICPKAKIIEAGRLENFRLMFIGNKPQSYATIEEDDGIYVPVIFWELPDDGEYLISNELKQWGDYQLVNIPAVVGGEDALVITHIKNENERLNPPDDHYYAAIYEAYEKYGFDLKILEDALAFSGRHIGWN